SAGKPWRHLAYYPFVQIVFPSVDENCPGHIQATVKGESCRTANDGSIQIEAFAMNTAAEFSWSNGAGNVTTLSNLSPGTYQVTATDAESCTYIRSFTIDSGSIIEIQPNIILDSCSAGNGRIMLNVSGGSAPYSILWNSENSTDIIQGIDS